MSFRISNLTKPVILSTSFPQVINNGNIDISGYYEVNGDPVNNSFYPALSTATAIRDIQCVPGNNSTGSSWNDITWSPSLNIVAMVRQGGSFINKIVTSSDGGINWVVDRKISTKSYQGVVWCSDLSGVGMFVSTQGNGADITISIDGVTWTDVSSPTGFSSGYGSLAYSPTLRRVVATAISSGYIYSNDGYNWVSVAPTQPVNNFYGMTWSTELGLFVAISAGVSKPINVSSDGINWKYYSPVNNPTYTGFAGNDGSVAWSPQLGIFCAVGNGVVLISSDGVNWTYYTSANLPFRNISWSPQLRIFFGGTGTNLVYSFNGTNWFSRNISGGGLKCSIWIPELGYLLTSGDSFSAFRSLPVPTSFNMFDSSFNSINELGLWNFQSFGRGRPVLRTDVSFGVTPGMNWIDVSNSSTVSIALPSASLWSGEEIMIKSTTAAVQSQTSNIIQLDNTGPSQTILSGGGKWATLVSNGTNWVIMIGN